MAIKVKFFQQTDGNPTSYYIEAFADVKSEVTNDISDFPGLPADATSIEQSSYIKTASGEMAYMKSNGQWNWV